MSDGSCNSWSLRSSLAQGTMSNGLRKSTKQLYSLSFLAFALSIKQRSTKMWSMVEKVRRKPDWPGALIPAASACVLSSASSTAP
ncbi:hypothetical protein KP509_1Z230200 [Ceratopteris richardii]|nr:hypothetical protein KP509_1Z230200 [Ceratopteris richardii]